MNTLRQNDLDIFTRIIHLGLVIFGLLAWATGEWADDYKKLKHIGFFRTQLDRNGGVLFC